ncbi:MAG: hypothetical protein HYY03_04865 [Chloroflexi bacterium]|nr:hypothetical protein [Chloroflexota bacterium]
MPTFTLTISDAHLTRLQRLAERYNAQAGTAYTVKDWLLVYLKDVAIAEEHALAIDQLRRQHEADAQAALDAAARAEHDRLLEAL